MPGWFAIGIEHYVKEQNIGTLWRSAHVFGASMLFTVGRPYTPTASDTTKAYRSIPLLHFRDLEALWAALPRDGQVVGIEQDPRAVALTAFAHPPRGVYLLGSERVGLSKAARARCHALVEISTTACLNVAVAGSIVLWHRTANVRSHQHERRPLCRFP